MRTVCAAVALGITLLGFVTSAPAAKGSKTGVFGRMHGMKLKAIPRKRGKSIVDASYRVDPALGSVDFTLRASERPKARGTTQNIAISCSSQTATLPWSADCIATYGEVRLKRRTFAQTIWAAAVHPDPDNLDVVGSFHVTVESFDGRAVRGRFSGSLDFALCSVAACAAGSDLGSVSGEGKFAVPVTF